MLISHLTSVHSRYDTRIFIKECVSLAAAGHIVNLIVADGRGDENKSGVTIWDVGEFPSRFKRIRRAPRKILKKAMELNCDAYHLHDPELIPIGLKLKKAGKKVIFDAHEDIPKQILNKPYLARGWRNIISLCFSMYESWACKKFDIVLAATPTIRDKFYKMGVNSVDVNNFPLQKELVAGPFSWEYKQNHVCYVGSIAPVRGILEMVLAMDHVASDVRLQIGGEFKDLTFKTLIEGESGWRKVDALGWLSRENVRSALAKSVAGLVVLHPVPNYLEALPVKMFEYMAAGIPVIASDFPMWRQIVDGAACGICVDPLNPRSIARAIDVLMADPYEAQRMGRNGQRAIVEKYNWEKEEKKLLRVYSTL